MPYAAGLTPGEPPRFRPAGYACTPDWTRGTRGDHRGCDAGASLARAHRSGADQGVDGRHRGRDGLESRQPDLLAGRSSTARRTGTGEDPGPRRATPALDDAHSPLMGLPDEPDNYHTVTYDIAPEGDRTRVTLTQDGNDTPEQAEQFSANWQNMLDALATRLVE